MAMAELTSKETPLVMSADGATVTRPDDILYLLAERDELLSGLYWIPSCCSTTD